MAISVLVQLIPLFGPVLLSRDVYAYWAYGQSPRCTTPIPMRLKPLRFRMTPPSSGWGRAGSKQRRSTARFDARRRRGCRSSDSPRAAALAFRLVATTSMLAIIGLAVLLVRNRQFAAAFVGWNPLLALHFAGGGHNDALMMALVLGALVLASRGRPGGAGLAWVAAIAVKWSRWRSPAWSSSAPVSANAVCSAGSRWVGSWSSPRRLRCSAHRGSERDQGSRVRRDERDRLGCRAGSPTSGWLTAPPSQ